MAVLDGKVALVTGGSSGIGAAAARLFRNEGALVTVTGTDPGKLEAMRAEPGIEAIACDVAHLDAIDHAMAAMRDRHGRIDILFANAGISLPSETIEQVTEASFDRIMNVNLKGMFFTVQKALPLMPDGAAIVLTSSVGAHSGMVGSIAYGASKAGVRSLGRSLAAALVARKIRVNVLTPGLVRTPLFDKFGVPAEKVIDRIVKLVPMGRAAEAEEAAAVALFLASPAASFVTGSEYRVTGGQSEFH